MARRILPHAPSAALQDALLAMGEIVVDETTGDIRIGDGATLGGNPAGKMLKQSLSSSTAALAIGTADGPLQDVLNGKAPFLLTPPAAQVGAVIQTIVQAIEERDLTPEKFGAVGNGVADDTDAFERLIAAAIATGKVIRLSPRKYRITRTLSVIEEIRMIGSGASTDTGSVLINDTGGSGVLFNISVGAGRSIIGLEMAHFVVTTPGSYELGWNWGGTAFYIDTAPGVTIHNSAWRHIRVLNHHGGWMFGGVFYQCSMENLFVTGSHPQTGNVKGPTFGFKSHSFQDITYNYFNTLEVTNLQDGGMAYDISSHFSTFNNLTCDGPLYLNSPGGRAMGVVCEHFTPASASHNGNAVMNFTNFRTIMNPAIRAVPSARAPIGIFVGGNSFTLVCPEFNEGAPGNANAGIPTIPVYLDGKGIILGAICSLATVKIPLTGPGGLNGTVAINADAITDWSLVQIPDGTWTPTFPNWEVAPTVSAARWSRNGKDVTLYINANGGKTGTDGKIGGVPFPASDVVGGVGHGAGMGKFFAGAIPATSSEIQGITPGVDLETSLVYWQFTVTYRIA